MDCERSVINETTAPYVSPDVILDITTDETWIIPESCTNAYPSDSEFLGSDVGSAKAYIKYGVGNSELRKPLIFVDGLDFGSSEKRVTDPLHGQIVRYGRNGWDALIRGSHESFIDYANGDFSEFELYPQQFSNLLSEGYDIIFLDFERGADYIQKNALLLRKLIIEVNQLKVPDPETGQKNENVIIGASMGGQIAKYTLAKMEKDGESHCTRTYVSFDSPQQGANITMGLQATAWYFYAAAEANPSDCDDKNDAQKDLWNKLNEPAARQLLFENFGGLFHNGDIDIESWVTATGILELQPPVSGINYLCLRDNFVETIEGLGYPQSTRNVAISCGSGTGIDQGYIAQDRLFNANVYVNQLDYGTTFRLGIFANKGGNCNYNVWQSTDCLTRINHTMNNESEVIFAAAQPYEEICANKVPLSYLSTKVKRLSPTPSFDNAPGCNRTDLYSVLKEVKSSMEAATEGINVTLTNEIEDGRTTQCFMPTMSTLDIDWELNDGNLWRDIKTSFIVENGLTPFDAYYAPEQNLKHVEMDQGMINWINAELENSASNLSAELPTVQGATYNFANRSRNMINAISVNDGGYLRVNHISGAGFGNEINNAPTVFDSRTSYCSGNIIINDGGYFILGNDDSNTSSNKKANVRIMDGAYVEIKPGGTLRLARGSKLIIESGATLEIDEDANIDLWWAESNIHVKEGGELIIKGAINFTGSGYIQLDEDHIFTQEGRFQITGQGDDFLQMNKNSTLEINHHGIELKNGGVRYDVGSRIQTAPDAEVKFEAMKLTGISMNTDNNVALEINDASKVNIWKTVFRNLNAGIISNNSNLDIPFNIAYVEVTNCVNGFIIEQTPGLFILRSQFKAGSDLAISALELSNMTKVLISGSQISGYDDNNLGAVVVKNIDHLYLMGSNIFDNSVAVKLDDVAYLNVYGGSIDRNLTGIYIPISVDGTNNETNVFLFSQASVSNNEVGVHFQEGGGVTAIPTRAEFYGMFTMDCAELYNNEIGVLGDDVLLNIDAYLNSNTTNEELLRVNKIHGEGIYFQICYSEFEDNVGSFVPARGNYWGGTTNISDLWLKIKVKKNSDNCPVSGHILSAAPMITTEPLGCKDEISQAVLTQDQVVLTPVISFPGGNFTENPDGTCELSSTSYSSETASKRHYLGYKFYRKGLYEDAKTRFKTTASVSSEEQDNVGAICKHYINVAKVMSVGQKQEEGKSRNDNSINSLSNKKIKIFPNPSNEMFRLESDLIDAEYKIYTMWGSVIQSGKFNLSQLIDSKDWESGIYIVEVLFDGEVIAKEKMIITY